jgi:plasmid maintenance system killer protein
MVCLTAVIATAGVIGAIIFNNELTAKLHPLQGDREGEHAIWINDKYRVCFVWSDDGATDVEITDYH